MTDEFSGAILSDHGIGFCQSQARLKPKRCLVGFIFTLEIIKINNKTTFVSYLNSPRKGCPRDKKIWVWTHLKEKKKSEPGREGGIELGLSLGHLLTIVRG